MKDALLTELQRRSFQAKITVNNCHRRDKQAFKPFLWKMFFCFFLSFKPVASHSGKKSRLTLESSCVVFFRNGPFFGAAEREVRSHRSEDEAAIGGQADFSTAGRRREKWKPWNDATSAADAASVDYAIVDVVVRNRCRRKSLSTLVVGCRPKAQFGFFSVPPSSEKRRNEFRRL